MIELIKANREIEAIYLHCTATKPGVPVSVESIRRYHVDVRGWSDIGYHYLVQPDGRIDAGRPVDRPGGHVRGDNKRTVGVSMVGNWDEAEPARDDPQIWNTGVLIAKLLRLYNLSVIKHDGGVMHYGLVDGTAILHRDAHLVRAMVPNPHKSCPGKNIETEQFYGYITWHLRHNSEFLDKVARGG